MALFGSVRFIKVATLAVAVFVNGPLFAGDLESAHDLMARMAKASRDLDYRGLFTYEYRGNLTSVKVMHSVRDGKTYERVVHLDGPKRQVLRRTDNAECLRTGDMLLRGNAYKITKDSYARLEDFYEFHIKGDDRVADRHVSMVHVIPKDTNRYGYIVAIDKESGLLLQSVLMNHLGKPLERFQFVEIAIGNAMSDDEFAREAEQFAKAGVDQSNCLDADGKVDTEGSRWQTEWLPPGFVLASYQPADASGQESMMFTDGLAVFSVFIDSTQGNMLPPVDAKLGATVAVLTNIEINKKLYTICVVGEIPRATASQIASAITQVLL